PYVRIRREDEGRAGRHPERSRSRGQGNGLNPSRSALYIDASMKIETQVIVRPARNVRGSVILPGDKSVSHRYAMLAGIAEGPSRLENYSTGADCASTLSC